MYQDFQGELKYHNGFWNLATAKDERLPVIQLVKSLEFCSVHDQLFSQWILLAVSKMDNV